MKTVNINASTNSKRIPIGRCEDNEATRVVFDCSGFSSAYGSGQATLLHRRSKEKISYIVQGVTQADDAVTWTVSSDDTAFSGEGTLQLMWTVNDVVAHSHFYTTITDPSLTDSSTEPTEVKSALQLLIDSCYTKEETDDLIAHIKAGSDWDANEGEDGYVENRPLYKENNYIELINDTYNFYRLVEGSAVEHPEWVGWYFGQLQLPYIALNNNEIYKVILNGIEYFIPTSKIENVYYIGNPSDWEETETDPSNFEYPFIIFTDENFTGLSYLTQDSTKTEITLSVYKKDFIYHKLDPNYLDTENTIATHTYVNNGLATKADKATTYTKTEVDTALSAKAGTSVATTSANGLMSSTDKSRLDDLYADYSSAMTALGVN